MTQSAPSSLYHSLRIAALLFGVLSTAAAQTIINSQTRLYGSGAIPTGGQFGGQGNVVAVSADGSTVAVSDPYDNNVGAVWVFTQQNGSWVQQGGKIAPYPSTALDSTFGFSLALSGNGNILLVGNPADDAGGAVWVLVRTNGAWNSGTKITVSDELVYDPDGEPDEPPHSAFGESVSISSDGTTALITGPGDDTCDECVLQTDGEYGPGTGASVGAVWWFTGSGGSFSELAKIVAPAGAVIEDAVVEGDGQNGFISGLVGGDLNAIYPGEGGLPTVWKTGVGNAPGSPLIQFSSAISCIASGSVSSNGAVGLFVPCVGSPAIYNGAGASVATLAPPNPPANGYSGAAISGSGLYAAIGGYTQPSEVWLFSNVTGQWSPDLGPLTGTGAATSSIPYTEVALSSDATTMVYGSPGDSNGVGAAWVFSLTNCTYSLPTPLLTLNYIFDHAQIPIVTQAGCPWTAAVTSCIPSSDCSWATVSAGSGSGSANLGVTVQQNLGPARSATITVNGQTATVQQLDGCTFVVNPTSIGIGAAGTANSSQTITVTPNQPGDGRICTWTDSASASWITATPDFGKGTIKLSVQANTPSGTGGSVSKRTGNITINDNNSASIGQTATPAIVIPITQDGAAAIDGVEVTQAIQVYETLAQMTQGQQTNPQVPLPVGLVALKPTVVRVMMQQVTEDTVAALQIQAAGCGSNQYTNQATKSLKIEPYCTPQAARAHDLGCQSIDFDCTPPVTANTGTWAVSLTSLDANNLPISGNTYTLGFTPITTFSAPPVLNGVKVCTSFLQCSQQTDLNNVAALMQKILPIPSLKLNWFPGRITLPYNPNLDSEYWESIAQQASDQFYGGHNDPSGINIYAGVVPTQYLAATQFNGAASSTPSHGFSVANTDPLSFPPNYDAAPAVAAYYLAEALGQHQNNVSLPQFNSVTGYGCQPAYSDTTTNWPFPDNLLHYVASDSGEIGFDVVAHAPILPTQYFDLMGSLCTKSWISPYNYNAILALLAGGASSSSSSLRLPAAKSARVAGMAQPAQNSFWTVSGTINGNLAAFNPIFVVNNATISASAGSGTWQIQAQNSSGTALFTTAFTPSTPAFQAPATAALQFPQNFSTIIPVTAGVTQILVLNDSNTPVGSVQFGGTPPVPHLTTALSGTVAGAQTIAWTITDPNNSATFTSRVFYSNDNGADWWFQGQGAINSLMLDFDQLPGSSGASLVRVDVSDGVNTGSTVSAAFSVARKPPNPPTILTPAAGGIFLSGQLVQCQASIYDVDDGLLDGSAVAWSDNVSGALGTGALLNVYGLAPGTHLITVTGTDSDGNSVSAQVTITVAGAGPTIDLSFTGLNNTPVSCVQATVAAAPGSVPLASGQYSFDGGMTFYPLPVTELPATIGVPGTGPIHFLAHVFDAAGQLASADQVFTIASACMPAAALTAAPPTIGFQAVQGGDAPAPVSLNIGAGASVNFAAAAISTGSWLSVSAPAGPAPQTLSVTVNPAGLSDGPYNGSIVITPLNGGAPVSVPVTLNVTGACSISLPATTASQPSTGGTGAIAITASDPSCPWIATSEIAWLTLTSAPSGAGPGTVSYSAAANQSVTSRSGNIAIAGQTFAVTEAGVAPSFTLAPPSAAFPAAGGTAMVTVTATPSDAPWTASTTTPWITITSGASGTGNGAVSYTVAANTSANLLTGTITIAGQTFTVTESAANSSFSILPMSAAVPAAGGTGMVAVTASLSNAAWTAASNVPWITITSGASGTGNGSVSYSVAAINSVNARTGTVSIAGQTFTVNQSGATPSFTIQPTSAGAPAAGAAGTVAVTATPPDASWTATSNVPWITITAGASGSGNGSVSYSVAANGSVNPQTGTLTIAGQTFTINQSGAGTTFSIQPTSATAPAAGASGSIAVTATPASASWTAASNVAWITIGSGASGTGNGTVGYSVAALNSVSGRTGTLTIAGQTFTVNQSGATPAYSLSPTSASLPAAGGPQTVSLTAAPPDAPWTVSGAPSWIAITSATSGAGSATISYTAAANTSNNARSGSLTIAGLNFPITQAAATTTAGLGFYSVTPCRVVDTRNGNGPFGGPIMSAGSTRSFAIPSSACGIPSTAQAYSLNITVVPPAALGYLTAWPAGQAQPYVSTLNSSNGAIIANAAIVPAGTGGSISIYVSDTTHVIIDINGYFGAPGGSAALAFYPVTPCRVADTRNPNGPFGGPSLAAGATRNFAVPQSSCGIPSGAQAYSLNMTVVPPGALEYLSTWPAGQSQPVVSTLNALQGQIAANAAIVPAGTNGAISVYVSDPSNVVIDINGYFAPPGGAGALYFYPVTPCRVADTRNASGTFGGPSLGAGTTRSFPIPSSSCGLPAAAQAYSFNMTVVPPGSLLYLSTWPAGQSQPVVSTLNDLQGQVVANAAIVPAGASGGISVFVSDATNLIIDVNGYFGQ